MTSDANSTSPTTVLVLGATGYVGGRLVPQLVAAGYRVRCLVRSPRKLVDRPWRHDVEVVEGDLLEPDTLAPAFEGIELVYYLVHSLGTGDDFEETERRCAEHVADAAEAAGSRQIVFLGGLGEDGPALSPHLRSRHAVGRALAGGATPVTEMRAAVILGSGSASFEMLRGLTEILPAMITPQWVQRTRCQPIAIGDVLRFLLGVADRDDAEGVWQIGGADVVSYADMIRAFAEVAGLRPRVIVPVPVLTPSLSTHWVDLVTSLPSDLAAELVGSLQNDVVVTDRDLRRILPVDVLDLRSALEEALAAVQDLDVPTRWTSGGRLNDAALPRPWDPEWAGGTVLEDARTIEIDASPADVMGEVRSVGGATGWLGYDVLWNLRAISDAVLGGVGTRRGRRHPRELLVGDTVDSFRVAESTATLLRLRAEMRMPGHGWLEWAVEETQAGRTTLTQTARFVPSGLSGRAYWWSLIPFHHLIFRRLLTQLGERAESGTKRSDPGVDNVTPPVRGVPIGR